MEFLDLTFSDPADNLACDEALIEWFEAHGEREELCRIWEPRRHFVVLGYSNKLGAEANIEACARRGIPILRRFSGGGAVLQGPGCLNYTLILRNDPRRSLTAIASAFTFVLDRHREYFTRSTGRVVKVEGISDLTADGRKFSGNAQHRKRRYLLVHGTVMLGLDLALLEQCLPEPRRQPAYRAERPHRDFVVNLELDPTSVKQGLRTVWGADREFTSVPERRVAALRRERYSREEWIAKF